MKAFVTDKQVRAFADTWPCSKLPRCGITFDFDGRGNLVDITFTDNREHPEVDEVALRAMSEDAFASIHLPPVSCD